MTDILKFPVRAEVEDEAAAWLWRLDDETSGPATRQALEAWLQRDIRNRHAFEEFERLWRQLDDLGEAKRQEKIATFAVPPKSAVPRHRLRWMAGIAATVLMLVTTQLLVSRGPTSQVFATAVGQQRTETLSDRSVVSLNTNTIVETHFTSSVRDVYLRKGEAHFVVAHNRVRPFLVHAGTAVVRAVGTEFDVRVLNTDQVEVVVDEGRVEVQATYTPDTVVYASSPKRSTSVTRILDGGEMLWTGSEDLLVRSVSAKDLSRSTAWRHGEVVFDGEPLEQAITELGRYTDTRLVVTDRRIANLPVGGRFRTDNLQDFLAALEKAIPVTVRRTPDGEVHIEPR